MYYNRTKYQSVYISRLRWDPKKRYTPEQATRHEWLQSSQAKTPSTQPPSPPGGTRTTATTRDLPPIHNKMDTSLHSRNANTKIEPSAFPPNTSLTAKTNAMTNSVSDLESAHQYSVYRLFYGKKNLNSKLGGSGTGSMHHSQSTGDVSAMFSQA